MAHTDTPWKLGKPDAQFSGSEEYPYMVVVGYGVGPCGKNVVGCRMSEDDARYIVRAVNAFEPMRELLFRAIVELEYVQNVENCQSGLCASQEGNEIIEEGMKLLGVKDLSENALALADKEQQS